MPLTDRDCSILEHIILYCNDIDNDVKRFGDSMEAFKNDKSYRNSCAMCILQIGELGALLSEEFRTVHHEIPWKQIKAMRNVMAHAYGDISIEATWETIKQDIPRLKEFCTNILNTD